MINLLQISEILLFYFLTLSVSYLFVFAVASKFYHRRKYPLTEKVKRFAVLFPAYKEDKVILQSVTSFLQQDYPTDKYEVIVISDQMEHVTNEQLNQLPIRLLIANYENSSKAKAMTLAMESTALEEYDMIVIMDADNTTTPDFLQEMNQACNAGLQAVQAHRMAKNTNTSIAILDAVSEEINNALFRKGHVAIGFSSALIGSGMALEANWFRKNVKLLQTAGEDKELETLLLKENIYIEYLEHVRVFDEKTQKKEGLKNQRKRWIAAQFATLRTALPYFPKALFTGNFDYCDKVLQWMLPPRIILLFVIFVFSCLRSIISLQSSLKWWILFSILVFTLIIAIPPPFFNKRTLKAITRIPLLALIMLTNLFHIKKANKEFIHTEHGNQSL
ncbi:glycosyltransferase [Bacteroides ihuae]|uniref:glycosyltransferase n=1 Tax=Bacteroides ihuae TaxID=1852362 RepID=UPI0008D8E257|nr:glycosyltransferase [Bacteroides ihuae]